MQKNIQNSTKSFICSYKHKLIIITILIIKFFILFILKQTLFNKPIAVHMKVEPKQITQHILN